MALYGWLRRQWAKTFIKTLTGFIGLKILSFRLSDHGLQWMKMEKTYAKKVSIN